MTGFDLLAAARAEHDAQPQPVAREAQVRLAERQTALRSRGATTLAGALGQFPTGDTPEQSGRYKTLFGMSACQRAGAWQATVVHTVLDSETGLLGIVEVTAIHGGGSDLSAGMIEAAIAGAVGAAFNWSDDEPEAVRLALGFLGSDQGVPSIIDVPEIGVTMVQLSEPASQDDGLAVAQIGMVLALLDALAVAGCAAPLPLPIAPDLVLRQLG